MQQLINKLFLLLNPPPPFYFFFFVKEISEIYQLESVVGTAGFIGF